MKMSRRNRAKMAQGTLKASAMSKYDAKRRGLIKPAIAPPTEAAAMAGPYLGQCPQSPARISSDQLGCRACHLVWDIDEDRPACPLKDTGR